jgi:hypothetical protein
MNPFSRNSAGDLSTISICDFRNLIPSLSIRYHDAGPVCSGLTAGELS